MNRDKFERILEIIRGRYPGDGTLPLHAPVFEGNEQKYLMETVDSTIVSSIGRYVEKFEEMVAEITGAGHCVAAVNGTCALEMALLVSGVEAGDEVLTQAATFAATANAIRHRGARPVFLDIDPDTLGLSAGALSRFLEEHTEMRDGQCRNLESGRRISACVPMHTFGHPCEIRRIVSLCEERNIEVVEDAAEALGSSYRGQACGTFGIMGIFSFNGNKIVTCGGGGAIVTDDPDRAERARHLTTQAKIDHPWEFRHDEVGYNYRMPNLNAALACAQLEQLDTFLENKRETAAHYREALADMDVPFHDEPAGATSNFWLNAIYLENRSERDAFLSYANDRGIQSRPLWGLIPRQAPYRKERCGPIDTAEAVSERLVNIPSSYTG